MKSASEIAEKIVNENVFILDNRTSDRTVVDIVHRERLKKIITEALDAARKESVEEATRKTITPCTNCAPYCFNLRREAFEEAIRELWIWRKDEGKSALEARLRAKFQENIDA